MREEEESCYCVVSYLVVERLSVKLQKCWISFYSIATSERERERSFVMGEREIKKREREREREMEEGEEREGGERGE